MWLELFLSCFVSLMVIPFSRGQPNVRWMIAISSFLLCVGFGTIGIWILATFAVLALERNSACTHDRVSHAWLFWISPFLVMGIILSRRSGWGRILGIFEGVWMAQNTDFHGVGWGHWIDHQAQAQRIILEMMPLGIFKETAAFFAVAPSLPAHLLAELGSLGLALYLSVLLISFVVARNFLNGGIGSGARVFCTFLVVSMGTTPLAYLMTVDSLRQERCAEALSSAAEGNGDLSKLSICPEIQSLEWTGSLLEAQGRWDEARQAYFLWHQTFPTDVIPIYALGRLAALSGRSEESQSWFRLASSHQPTPRDTKALALFSSATNISRQSSMRPMLWMSFSRWKGLR